MPTETANLLGPLYVMAKPAGAMCNLACTYCYYLEKKKLYGGQGGRIMDDALLERFVREYIGMQPAGAPVLFTWHGGEPLMRPMSFYRKALDLQHRYAEGRRIDNCLQTNGTLLTADWAKFLRQEHFLVGVSVDGGRRLHDAYRRSRGGRPSFQAVERGIRLLQAEGVEWNVMSVVTNLTAAAPEEWYEDLCELGTDFIQMTPVVERVWRHSDGRLLAAPHEGASAELAPFSVTAEQWGEFLCRVFDVWVRRDVGRRFVQLFDSTLSGWMGLPPGVCSMAETCGHAGAMEWNGDVYSCDHFVFPEYLLGNLRDKPLVGMMLSQEQLRFGQGKRDGLTEQCRECEWLFACHGECPRTRFAFSRSGEAGHSFLCEGYRRYFAHVAPVMDRMKQLLQKGEAPAKVMQDFAQGGRRDA